MTVMARKPCNERRLCAISCNGRRLWQVQIAITVFRYMRFAKRVTPPCDWKHLLHTGYRILRHHASVSHLSFIPQLRASKAIQAAHPAGVSPSLDAARPASASPPLGFLVRGRTHPAGASRSHPPSLDGTHPASCFGVAGRSLSRTRATRCRCGTPEPPGSHSRALASHRIT